MDFIFIDQWPNKLAGVGAGRTPEVIEMMKVDVNHKPGLARLVKR
jgi:hypothetical protein